MKSKRVIVLGDMHSGHRAGLTPPQWQTKPDDSVPQKAKWARTQAELWNFYKRTVADLAPIDILIVNGDLIDGKGEKSGGTELITSDRGEQAEMAFQAIAMAQAKEVRIVRGTPYHAGATEDFENNVADKLGCKIGDHEWYDINGVVFDVKHHIAFTGVPHTKGTALLRDALWNLIWAKAEGQPDADIIIRSHVHTYWYCCGMRPDQLAMTTPAMQGMGSKFGARQCSRMVDVGMVSFDIERKGKWTWRPHLMSLKLQAACAEKL